MVYILDKETTSGIREALCSAGMDAELFNTADAFFGACRQNQPSLVIVRLWAAQTHAFRNAMKAEFVRSPVLVICGDDTAAARAEVLNAGADDVISAPFEMTELVARAAATLRRESRARSFRLEHEGIALDDERRRVTIDGKPQPLTYTEYEILKLLLRDVGKVQSRQTILERVWGPSDIGETRAVDMHIAALRRKLGKHAQLIQTMRGTGYVMVGPANQP